MTVPGNGVLLLTYSAELEDGKPLYVSSNCHPIKALGLEPAGFSFHAAALRLLGYEDCSENDNDDKSEFDEKDRGHTTSYDSYSYKGKRVLILMRVRAYMEGECLVLNRSIHHWHVGIMKEMALEGYVGISRKCVLRFNKNY